MAGGEGAGGGGPGRELVRGRQQHRRDAQFAQHVDACARGVHRDGRRRQPLVAQVLAGAERPRVLHGHRRHPVRAQHAGSLAQARACFVLEHLREPERALAALRRVLRPGGTITVIEGDHGSAFHHPPGRYAQAEGFTRRTFIAMVEAVRGAAPASGGLSEEEWNRGIAELERTGQDGGVFHYAFFKGIGFAP